MLLNVILMLIMDELFCQLVPLLQNFGVIILFLRLSLMGILIVSSVPRFVLERRASELVINSVP